MSVLGRALVNNIGRIFIFPSLTRSITLAPVQRFKEIIETKEGNTLTIEARIVPDPDESRLVNEIGKGPCPLCALGLEVKHTDVLILSQFLRSDGCVLPKRITGLCKIQQKRLQTLVAMAQKAGLMSNLTPAWSYKDPKRRYQHKRYNSYYDETTIRRNYKNVSYRE